MQKLFPSAPFFPGQVAIKASLNGHLRTPEPTAAILVESTEVLRLSSSSESADSNAACWAFFFAISVWYAASVDWVWERSVLFAAFCTSSAFFWFCKSTEALESSVLVEATASCWVLSTLLASASAWRCSESARFSEERLSTRIHASARSFELRSCSIRDASSVLSIARMEAATAAWSSEMDFSLSWISRPSWESFRVAPAIFCWISFICVAVLFLETSSVWMAPCRVCFCPESTFSCFW